MKFLFKTLILIFLSQAAFAQTAAELVQRDVEKGIKKFSRETRLYHYFFMNVNVDDQGNKTISRWFLKDNNLTVWLNDLVAARAGAFWDLNNHNTVKTNAGLGMYLALDPNSSREYGDTMVLLDIPAGSQYITTVKPIPFKPDTLAALVRENIVQPKQLKVSADTMGLEAGLTAEVLHYMVLPENNDFRILMQNVFQNLGIKMIEYGYKSHQNGFCKGGRLTAIVYIGSKPADQTSEKVSAVVDPEFKTQHMAADYLIGFFDEVLNSIVDLTVRYQQTVAEIRATAFDAPKVVNWPKALAIIDKHMNAQEAAQLRDISFECKSP